VKKTKLTPPQLAAQWGIKPEKVIAWIRSGELRAMDASTRAGIGRPRYLIDETDVIAFENAREVRPRPKPARRRRADQQVIKFF
jgi:hypothetical protein